MSDGFMPMVFSLWNEFHLSSNVVVSTGREEEVLVSFIVIFGGGIVSVVAPPVVFSFSNKFTGIDSSRGIGHHRHKLNDRNQRDRGSELHTARQLR